MQYITNYLHIIRRKNSNSEQGIFILYWCIKENYIEERVGLEYMGKNSRCRECVSKFLEECLGNNPSRVDQLGWDRIKIRL